jgi:hypothetical protein
MICIFADAMLADRNDAEGLDEAATLFQRALDRDPTFADAAAALASTYTTQVRWAPWRRLPVLSRPEPWHRTRSN